MSKPDERSAHRFVLDVLSRLNYAVASWSELTRTLSSPEVGEINSSLLETKARSCLASLNRSLPTGAVDEALSRLRDPAGSTLEAQNRSFHRMLTDGIAVEYRRADGSIGGVQARVIDFENPFNNDWLAVTNVAVTERAGNIRLDVVIYVNGVPLALIELKSLANDSASSAYLQLDRLKKESSSLLIPNAIVVVSDGLSARIGTIDSNLGEFAKWRTIAGVLPENTSGTRVERALAGCVQATAVS